MTFQRDLQFPSVYDLQDSEISHAPLGSTALQLDPSMTDGSYSANESWCCGSSEIASEITVPTESDHETVRNGSQFSKSTGISPKSNHIPESNGKVPEIPIQNQFLAILTAEERDLLIEPPASNRATESTNIITSFELLFLAAVAEHLPSLVPLLAKTSGQRARPSSALNKRLSDKVHQIYALNKRPRMEDMNTGIYTEKAIGHLEAEYLYNPTPSDDRKAALSTFTGLDFYAVDKWFKDKTCSEGSVQQHESPSLKKLLSGSFNLSFDSSAKSKLQRKENITQHRRPEKSQKATSEIIQHHKIITSNMDVHRPFPCTKVSCSMTFRSKSDWKRHEETHYPQSQYVCLLSPNCESKTFPRKDKFLDHLKRAHENQVCTSQMRGWQRPIPASHESLVCPICARQFSGWQERCDHVAEMFEASSKLLQEEKARMNPKPPNLKTQGTRRRRFSLNRQRPKVVPLRGLGDVSVDKYLPVEPKGQQFEAYDDNDGMSKTGDFMQGLNTQSVLLDIPRMNLF